MKVSPKDMPKVLMLVVLIGGCLIYIFAILMNRKPSPSEPPVAQGAPAPNIVAGTPQQTAALEPQVSPEQYKEQIEEWSKPPTAPVTGNPFRAVLPRDIAAGIANQRANRLPNRQISGTGFGPGTGAVDPTLGGLPNVRIDFPTITVQGVVVDTSTGSPTNFASLLVDNSLHFAKQGDVIGNDLVVEKVSLNGIQVRAAKEHAFIEVSKSYKPNGMAPPAPPKPASHRHSSHRR